MLGNIIYIFTLSTLKFLVKHPKTNPSQNSFNLTQSSSIIARSSSVYTKETVGLIIANSCKEGYSSLTFFTKEIEGVKPRTSAAKIGRDRWGTFNPNGIKCHAIEAVAGGSGPENEAKTHIGFAAQHRQTVLGGHPAVAPVAALTTARSGLNIAAPSISGGGEGAEVGDPGGIVPVFAQATGFVGGADIDPGSAIVERVLQVGPIVLIL